MVRIVEPNSGVIMEVPSFYDRWMWNHMLELDRKRSSRNIAEFLVKYLKRPVKETP